MDPFALGGRSLDTDLLIFRSLFALDSNTKLPISTAYVLATDGQGGLKWQDIFTNIATYSALSGGGIGYLPTTIDTLNRGVQSLSTISAIGYSTLSTNIGYGGIPGSITGPQLYSTTGGTNSNTAAYVLSSLASTVNSFNQGGLGYTPYLISSLQGLATFGYPSTQTLDASLLSTTSWSGSSLTSSIQGLGSLGYVSAPQLYSTVDGLGTQGYISSPQLISSIYGLSQSTSNSFLSTVAGLGTAGYISSLSYLSTNDSLIRRINVDRAGSLVIYNSQVTISSLATLPFLSSFTNSSLTYKGINGLTMASTTNRDFYFSSGSLQFATHSNFLTSKTQISIDVFPTFLFCSMNLINSTQLYPLSTMIQYGQNILYDTTSVSYIVANGFVPGYSNSYQAPLRLTVKGGEIVGQYDDNYVLVHRIENCLSSNLTGGFQNSNVFVSMASTNSIFISMTNPMV